MIGNESDAAYYRGLSEQVRERILFEYVTPSGRLSIDTQSGYIIALKFKLFREREVVIEQLKTSLKLEILLKETPLEAEMKTMTAEQITAKFQNQAATAGYLLDFHLSDEDFFVDHQIIMNRHARYFAMPAHSHEFLELNYLLQGQCTQWIGQEKIQMKQGDLLMIDPGTGHSIDKLGEQDILINILIKSDAINTKVLQRMAQRHSDSEYASITLEGLGKQLNFNKNYLSNLLKQETGLTFKEWVTKRRLQKAYDLLIGTDKPIEKIVAELGITSPSYFFKIFKQEYGETPNHIRKKMHRSKKL